MLKRVINGIYRLLFVECYCRLTFPKLGKKNYIGLPIRFTPAFIKMGDSCYLHKNSRIEGVSMYEGVAFTPMIVIGSYVTIQQNIHLTCANSVIIEDNVAIAANVTISDINHPYEDITLPVERQQLHVSEVRIGMDSKLYNNVVILPGTILGKHNVIGANSVVSGVYPDYCVAVGAPARIVKRYCFERSGWFKTNSDGSFKD